MKCAGCVANPVEIVLKLTAIITTWVRLALSTVNWLSQPVA